MKATPRIPQPQAGQAKSALGSAIMYVADRIDALLDEERVALSSASASATDIDVLASRKSHLVIELMRLTAHISSLRHDDVACARLGLLSRNLAQNARLLRRHVDAVRNVSNIIAQAISQSNDDGTYTSSRSRLGAKSW